MLHHGVSRMYCEQGQHRSQLSNKVVNALEDCQLLAGLNVDFLDSAGSTINSTNTLLDPQTDKLQTLLSALITNQQTCLDGIQSAAATWTLKNGLSVRLANGTKLYSVSLSLFNRAWVKKKPKKGTRNVNVPPRFPVPPNGGGRRRLLQSSDAVMVSDIVMVSKDGTGNFTDITSAVASAPNNTDGSSGYYLIMVSAGVYEEYIAIPKNKKYVMMIGDGINQTVITSYHNNVDGWTRGVCVGTGQRVSDTVKGNSIYNSMYFFVFGAAFPSAGEN